MLQGKTVLLGVTGGIAAYKMPNVARMLKKMHCNVHVLMTQNATNFITATTFETLTGNKCLIDTFDRNFEFSVEHVALAKQADLVLLAPATANVIGKIANGIADDMLTTTVMACTCKVLVAPAMNHNMYHNSIVQENLEKLKRHGYEMIDPVCGMLANGDTGDGKLPSEETLVEYVLRELAFEKDMQGLKVLVTAGPTQEAIDPVRFYIKSFYRKDGVCHSKERNVKRCRSDTGYRQDGIRTADVCKNGSRNICKRYVSGGHGMCKRTGHYRKGCGSGRLHTGAYRR